MSRSRRRRCRPGAGLRRDPARRDNRATRQGPLSKPNSSRRSGDTSRARSSSRSDVEDLAPADTILHHPHVPSQVHQAQQPFGDLHHGADETRGHLAGPPGQGQPEAHLAIDEDRRCRHVQAVGLEDGVGAAPTGDLVPDIADRHQAGVGHHDPPGPEQDSAADDRGQPTDEAFLRSALPHGTEERVLQRHRPPERIEVVAQRGPVDEGDDVPEGHLERHFEDGEVPGPGLVQESSGDRPEYQADAEPHGGHAPGLGLGDQLALQLRVAPQPDSGGQHDVVPGGQLLGPVRLDGLGSGHRAGEGRR